MNKAVLISIKPKWCERIASGKKTVEVRKTRPTLETPFKCYIYCTKPKMITKYVFKPEYYPEDMRPEKPVFCKEPDRSSPYCSKANGNGKVIGEFVCDKITNYTEKDLFYGMDEISNSDIENYSCMDIDSIFRYKGKKEYIFAWHISDVVIYDKPKELSDFKKTHRECFYADLGRAKRDCPKCQDVDCMISRPPKSWCYVEELEDV